MVISHFRMIACYAATLPGGAALVHLTLCVAEQPRLAPLAHS